MAALAALTFGCGSQDKPAEGRAEISRPLVATQGGPGARGPGVVVGEPSPDRGGGPPKVGVGAPGTACTGGGLQPGRDNIAAIGRATLCLLNAERRARGLTPLRSNSVLARAALGHARDMVKRSYFSHDSLSGGRLLDRVRRAGYVRRALRSWTVGENIAWGVGDRATPREIVDAWMHSPGHRANILRSSFREIGMGVAFGAPRHFDLPGATYNTDFGART